MSIGTGRPAFGAPAFRFRWCWRYNLAKGLTSEQIVQSYPTLTPVAIQAALAYAADLAEERVITDRLADAREA